MRFALSSLLLLAAWFGPPLAHAEAPLVLASTKPIHSLVASVMEGTGAMPKLIVEGTQSPHDFQLKPSHRQALADADVVFYVDDGFETFLPAALTGAKPGARRIALLKDAQLGILRERFAESDAMAETAPPINYHVWLSAANGAAMAQKIAETLAEVDPAQKEKYLLNAHELRQRLQRKDAELSHRLAPVIGRPFLVFHDASAYFEQRYGLTAKGAVTRDPESPISAGRLARLRRQVAEERIRCVFREPEFSSRLVEQITEGSGARIEILEPEGGTITPGPALYETMLDQTAEHFLHCLSDQPAR